MTIRADAHKPEFHRAAPPQLPVRVATTANVTIATALNAGDTIDGVTLATGDRVLVKDQSTGAQNGIYIAGASPARAFDMEEGVAAWGAIVYVIAGTANGGKAFKNTNVSLPTIGSTALTWAEFGAGVSAHSGLSGLSADDHPQYLKETDVAAKGDMFAASANDVVGVLGVGANGKILTADSAEALGVKWGDAPTGTVPSGTDPGDILIWDGAAWDILPIGADDEQLTADSGEPLGAKWAGAGGSATPPQPNILHNSRFRTNQRAYASAGSLASGEYGFDRWKATTASTSLTFTAAPQGQQVTISSGGSIAQVVERANMPAGDYVLSWEGTATGRIYLSGGSPPSYAASPVTVTLDGSAHVVVEFEANGGTKTLDKVKLETGSSETAYVQQDVQVELWQCMRFFQLVTGWHGHGNGTTVIEATYAYPVRMRDFPSLTKYPGATLNYRNNGADTNVAAATWNIANNTQGLYALWTQFTGNTGLTGNRPYHSRIGANNGPILMLSADL